MRKTLAAIAVLALGLGAAWAEPETGTYFLSVTNGNVALQQGTGYGGVFYRYPSGWWNMWWPNVFEPVYQKRITINFFVVWPTGEPQPEVAFNWSAPSWSDPNTPPLVDEFVVREQVFYPITGYYEATIVVPFCPRWVSVDIRGAPGSSNTFIFSGTIAHECMLPGACCYGPPDQCLCADLTWPECQALGGVIHPGETCATYQCDAVPPVITCPPDITFECDESTDPEDYGALVIPFDDDPVLGDTQATGVWYTDRYPPAGFVSELFLGDNRLKHSIDASDCESCRPAGYNFPFYNTQGRKYDIPGAQYMRIDLYVPSDWAVTGRRMAGFWGTGFDSGGLVSAYPIIEFTSTSDGSGVPRVRAYGAGTGLWPAVGLPPGVTDAWYTLEIERVGPTGSTGRRPAMGLCRAGQRGNRQCHPPGSQHRHAGRDL
jgi:hypothetical protein